MKSKILAPFLLAVLGGCVHTRERAPLTYRALVSCHEGARLVEKNPDKYDDKMLACGTVVDAFFKSQDTYKLNATEQITAFDAAFAITSYQRNSGARGLDEVFSRLAPKDRTTERARHVFDSYLKERDFARAAEFRDTYANFQLPEPPRVANAPTGLKLPVYRVVDRKTLALENYRAPAGAHIVVMCTPNASGCERMRTYLRNNTGLYSRTLTKMLTLMPQDNDLLGEMAWIAEHPGEPARIVFREGFFADVIPEWDRAPKIYFLKGSDIQLVQEGWSDDGPKQFRQGLHAIGLL